MKKLTVLTIIIASVFMLTPIFGQVYPDGMVSYWKFEEGNGSIASDSVGNNTGTVSSGASWESGIVGGALEFGGTDYVEVPDHLSLNPSYITVEAWVYLTSFGYYRGFVTKKYQSGWAYPYVAYQIGTLQNTAEAASSVRVNNGEAHYTSSTNPLLINAWSHVVSTYDGNSLTIYVNGALEGENPAPSGPIDYRPYPLYIGYVNGTNNYFYGKIDEVAIYNRALTPDEIQQHYQNGLNGLGYEEYITTVDIDIKPGSYPNAINLGSHGLTPVAIFSEVGFDAKSVDPNTIKLSGALVARRGKGGEKYMAHEEDVNEDGLVDLVVQVVTADIDPSLLVTVEEDNVIYIYAVLTGSTYDSEVIEGEDEITIVPTE